MCIVVNMSVCVCVCVYVCVWYRISSFTVINNNIAYLNNIL